MTKRNFNDSAPSVEAVEDVIQIPTDSGELLKYAQAGEYFDIADAAHVAVLMARKLHADRAEK